MGKLLTQGITLVYGKFHKIVVGYKLLTVLVVYSDYRGYENGDSGVKYFEERTKRLFIYLFFVSRLKIILFCVLNI